MRTAAFILAVGILGSPAALAGVVFPPEPLERGQTVKLVYRLAEPVSGTGRLDLEWRDVAGRLVERRRLTMPLDHASEFAFSLDLRRAVAMKNSLHTHLSLSGVDGAGTTYRREEDENHAFVVRAPDPAWSDYRIIMWQPQGASQYAALKRLGVDAAAVEAIHDAGGEPNPERVAQLLDDGLQWYVENIATDFYSPYHRWSGDRPVNWRLLEAKRLFRQDPANRTAFLREPSLSDPAWLERIRKRIDRVVRAQAAYGPLYYSLGDETGIADLSANWDFDLSDASLGAMREWLRRRYTSLDALNAEWGSQFPDWGAVTPMTTAEAVRRGDENFAAWADFKEWMDEAFARALRAATDAAHRADPAAYAAIEGGQIPGWGGYDYARLATAVDLMELYDYGDNVEIVRSFNPRMVVLTTSFRSGPAEIRRIWRELLRGSGGLILWDEANGFTREDGTLGPRGRALAATFHELRGGIGALLLQSARQFDPIAMLYSPASMRIQWMLDRRHEGDDWVSRNASSEYADNAIRTATRDYAQLIEHSGLQHRYVSSAEVERGELVEGKYRVVILPDAIALSSAEADAIRAFMRKGGTVIADGPPGLFDQHGRRRAVSPLSDLFEAAGSSAAMRISELGRGKFVYLPSRFARSRKGRQVAAAALSAAGVTPHFSLRGPAGAPARDIESHLFAAGDVLILALQRDLAAAPSGFTRPHRAAETVTLNLPHPAFVYDLRSQTALGRHDRLSLDIAPVEPTLLAISDVPLPAPSIVGPDRLRAGEIGEFQFRVPASSGAAADVVHLDVLDPAGRIVPCYSGNLIASRGEATTLLPLALNDAAGTWRLVVTDLLTGQKASSDLEVSAR